MMKECTRCHRVKPLDQFAPKASRCRDCLRITKAEWIKANPDRQKEYERRRKAKIRGIIHDAKEVPCVDCGQRHPYYVMDFHHVRGEKKFNISSMKGGRYLFSQAALREEIAKCDVVCANCHRYRHAPLP